jgi:hypothetical protein
MIVPRVSEKKQKQFLTVKNILVRETVYRYLWIELVKVFYALQLIVLIEYSEYYVKSLILLWSRF